MKNIIAFILSLLAGFLALFQGGCAFVGGGAFAQYDREMAKIGAAGLLVVIAAIVGFVGGSMALAKKRKAFYLSYISAGMMFISAFFLQFNDGAIYSIIYMIAAMLTDYKFALRLRVQDELGRYFDKTVVSKEYPELSNFFINTPKFIQYFYYSTLHAFFFVCRYSETRAYAKKVKEDLLTHGNLRTREEFRQKVRENEALNSNNHSNDSIVFDNSEEDNFLPDIEVPVLTLQEALKLGLDALKAANFSSADKYFNDALSLNANSSTAYIGKLMVKLKVKNPNELVAVPVKLEAEQLFRKAWEYASPKTKETLKKYIQINRLKLSQNQTQNG